MTACLCMHIIVHQVNCVYLCTQHTAGHLRVKHSYTQTRMRILIAKQNCFLRPKMNALANAATGKGYESLQHLNDTSKWGGGAGKVELRFMDIENIHVVRSSYQGLCVNVCAFVRTWVFAEFHYRHTHDCAHEHALTQVPWLLALHARLRALGMTSGRLPYLHTCMFKRMRTRICTHVYTHTGPP